MSPPKTARWLIWTPFVLFVAVWAVLGWRAGWMSASLTETDVINTYAAQYLKDRAEAGHGEGAVLTDCIAYPGAPEDSGVWLIVSCGPTPFDANRQYEYTIGTRGQLLEKRGPNTWGTLRDSSI